jgi:hypothetical protein
MKKIVLIVVIVVAFIAAAQIKIGDGNKLDGKFCHALIC